ncbi:MAG: hypothetical protein MAG795_01155 [Candidatus Woesearchaeota archaeon]|nr:hypothetical protein [Candidatus Woesearchaeota archaeon]
MKKNLKDLKNKIIETADQSEIKLRFSHEFNKQISKIKDKQKKLRLFKQILKIVKNPSVGKPMRYSRKGEQEVYLDSFRLYYKYYTNENILRFVEFSHKKNQ